MSSTSIATQPDTADATSSAASADPGPDTASHGARVQFWADQALRLDWAEPWHTTHTFEPALAPTDGSPTDGNPSDTTAELRIPSIEWFAGGKLNAAVNCVDRHVAAGRGEKVALHFEGEPGDRRAHHLP